MVTTTLGKSDSSCVTCWKGCRLSHEQRGGLLLVDEVGEAVRVHMDAEIAAIRRNLGK